MIRRFAGLVAACGLLAGAVFAQGMRPGGERGTPPDPQTMIQRRVDRLATMLNLTDAQKTQATTIFTNSYNAAQGIQPSLQTNRESLSTAIKKNDTASIDSLSMTTGTLTGQLTGIHAKAEAQFYAILTPDQKTKYDQMPHGGPGMIGGVPGGFRGGWQR